MASTGDLHKLKQGFSTIDRDNSGSISSGELVDVLRAMGTHTDARDLRKMVSDGKMFVLCTCFLLF